MKYRFLALLLLLLVVLCSHASAEFIVHTIYFQPTDAPPLAEVEKRISDFSLLSQDLYMCELDRHGFGEKTYRLETKNTDDVNVHLVKGNKTAAYYLTDTSSRVFAELPNQFHPDSAPWHKQDAVRVIVVGGIRLVNNQVWGVGWPRHSNRYGGTCIVAGASPHFNQHLIAHEIGHCFGLYHRDGCDQCLMGPGNTELAHYEARWLDKHYHFNNNANNFTFPTLAQETPTLSIVEDTGIRFQLEVQSVIGLHQAVIFRQHDIMVIGFDYLNGKNRDTITIDAERHRWANIFLQIMDTRGNFTHKRFEIIKPPLEVLDKFENKKNPDTIVDRDEPDDEVEDDNEKHPISVEWQISSKNKLSTSWASLKQRR